MVIAKGNLKGNGLLLSVKERSGLAGTKAIRRINTMSVEAVLAKTSAIIKLVFKSSTIGRVPLHSRRLVFILLKSITMIILQWLYFIGYGLENQWKGNSDNYRSSCVK